MMDQQLRNMPQPMPMAPETPLTATLQAQEWNIVQAGLRELPMKYVEGIAGKLARQLFEQANELAPFQEQQP